MRHAGWLNLSFSTGAYRMLWGICAFAALMFQSICSQQPPDFVITSGFFWREIFHKDAERKQSWDEAVATFESMVSTYESLDYEIVLLPLASVEERAEFVARHLA